MSSRGNRRGGTRRGRDDKDGFEEWGGYMPAKIQKLQDQYRDELPEGPTSDIFNGVAIFVNGYTNPTSNELKKLMLQHGGTYHHYYRRSYVTHIIASNLCNSKIKPDSDVKVIKPEWITESVTAGKLLPCTQYKVFTSLSKNQATIGFKTADTKRELSEEAPKNDMVPCHDAIEDCEVMDHQDVEMDANLHVETASDQVPITPNRTQATTSTTTLNKTTTAHSPNISRSKISPQGTAGDARDSTFVSEFYSNSRLHHIATSGADFKAYVNKLRQQENVSFPGRDRLQKLMADGGGAMSDEGLDAACGKRRRVMMHVDMDCFFVSVGLRNRPELRGKPIAVTHSKGKSQVKERPGTDVDYEKAHWQKKRGLKSRRQSDNPHGDLDTNPHLLLMNNAEEMEEMMQGEIDGEMRDEQSIKQPSAEVFNSMAEIASCSYEARKAGVKNGMFMGKAKQLCPDLVTIPYDFDGYSQVSKLLYDTVASYTLCIEAVSCDEMLVDCTHLLSNTGASPLMFAGVLRQEIYDTTGCAASTGMGPNILMARMATRTAKPNGQHYVQEAEAANYIKEKSIKDLPGVGWALTSKLNLMGVETCGDLQKLSLAHLQKEFGPKTGQSLFNFCRGIDDRALKTDQERKSVSAEINYGIRFTKAAEMEKFLFELSEEVHTRLTNINVKGKTVTLKLKIRAKGAPKETAKFLGHGICDNITKSSTLPLATDDAKVIAKECMAILKPLDIPPAEYRGVGIQMSRLEKPAQQQTKAKGLQSILQFATVKEKPTGNNETHVPTRQELPLYPIKIGSCQRSAAQIEEDSRIESSYVENSLFVSDDYVEKNKDPRCQSPDSLPVSDIAHAVTCDVPPLPKLPSLSSPDSSFVMSLGGRAEKHAAVENDGCTKPQHSEPEDYFPSPSQVDPLVLAELPSDIREEIQRSMAARRKAAQNSPSTFPSRQSTKRAEAGTKRAEAGTKRAEAGTSGGGAGTSRAEAGTSWAEAGTSRGESIAVTEDSEEAGCSHWQHEQMDVDNDQIDRGERGSTAQDVSIVPLPSLSQLDPSCLDALPKEMRDEIETAYKMQTRTTKPKAPTRTTMPQAQTRTNKPQAPTRTNKPQAPATTIQNALKLQQAVGRSPGKTNKSPNKNKSPQAAKTSPKFKVPRGRPPKARKRLSPKKLDYHKTQTRPQTDVDDLNVPQKQQVELPQHEKEKDDESERTNHEHAATKVNLCGAVTLAEVKQMVQEWVTSCQNPDDDDIQQFLKYMSDLVYDKNLEQVYLLLKYLHRCSRSTENKGWQHGCSLIIQHTQEIVTAVYGAALKLMITAFIDS